MSIANPSVLIPTTEVAKRRYRPTVTAILVSAVALCSYIGGAPPVSADPNPTNTGPNPYGTLSCDCRETTPADSPAPKAEIDKGLREGHTAWVPGLPPPAQPGQPRP
jgi:hypothetical protein